MKFDTDEFNRREASVKLLTGECLRLIDRLQNGQSVKRSDVNPEIIEALKVAKRL